MIPKKIKKTKVEPGKRKKYGKSSQNSLNGTQTEMARNIII
jgi:hypothetical protein